jgi:hypothetical protein
MSTSKWSFFRVYTVIHHSYGFVHVFIAQTNTGAY